MCGRYTIIEADEISERFNADAGTIEPNPNYNVAPSQLNPTVSRNSPNKIVVRKWGLQPEWATKPGMPKPINAMSESVDFKPYFRSAFKSKRCIIPADGFIEWRREGKDKIPYLIRLKTKKLFGFAGLFEEFEDAGGLKVETYTIITKAAGALMQQLHHREPVILNKSDENVWLNQESTPVQLKKTFGNEITEADFEMFEVDKRINSPRNNNYELLKPTT